MRDASPPLPEQVRVYLAFEFIFSVTLPEVPREPLQSPEASQRSAFIALQLNSTEVPELVAVLLAEKVKLGAGIETCVFALKLEFVCVTVTEIDCVAGVVPTAPVQVIE